MTITTLTLTSVEEKRHNPGLTAITITHIDLRFNWKKKRERERTELECEGKKLGSEAFGELLIV